jgi:hypothetical protein
MTFSSPPRKGGGRGGSAVNFVIIFPIVVIYIAHHPYPSSERRGFLNKKIERVRASALFVDFFTSSL